MAEPPTLEWNFNSSRMEYVRPLVHGRDHDEQTGLVNDDAMTAPNRSRATGL